MPTQMPVLGRLRERLALQRATVATDTHGSPAQTFGALDTVPAELMPLRAGEQLQAEGLVARVDSRFRIRARSDLTPGMRALWRPSWLPSATPKLLEVHGIQPDPAAPTMYQLLDCGEVATP